MNSKPSIPTIDVFAGPGGMGDKSVHGGNGLRRQTLEACAGPRHEGPRVIYGEGCRLTNATLKRLAVSFKQLPYDVKVS